jgi:hypothetical protein
VPVLRTLIYFGRLRGMTRSDAQNSAERWLERLDLQRPPRRAAQGVVQGQPAEGAVHQCELRATGTEQLIGALITAVAIMIGMGMGRRESPRAEVEIAVAGPGAAEFVQQEAGRLRMISTPESSWGTASEANRIFPPVTYGQAPAGTVEDPPAEALVQGRTYELVLWRILPPGVTGPCMMTFGNACLVAVQPFTR